MVEAKLLRKKLKDGLIVDKWDLVTIIEKQQAEIDTLKAKTLTDEEIEQVRVAIMGAAYWCADENMPEAYNAVKVCCAQVLGILVKAQEK